MNYIEFIAALVAVVGIVFTILENRICWLMNILASAFYSKVFLDSQLPGQMLLQALYMIVGVFAFYSWGIPNNTKIKQLGTRPVLLLIILSISSGYLVYYLSDNLLWADTSLTIASFIATFLAAKKYIENWTLWAIINFASIGLFIYQNLKLTAALYLIYAILALVGLTQWSRQFNRKPSNKN